MTGRRPAVRPHSDRHRPGSLPFAPAGLIHQVERDLPGHAERELADRGPPSEPPGPVADRAPAGQPEPRLTTLASAFSPERGNAPARVQVVAEPGKMRVSERWRWDLNPRSGEISPITDMNTKTSEKSPDWGSHASTLAGAPRPASSGFAVCGLREPRDSGAGGSAAAQGSGRSGPVFCLVQQGDSPRSEFVQDEEPRRRSGRGLASRGWARCYRPRYLDIQRLNYLWTIRQSSPRLACNLIT